MVRKPKKEIPRKLRGKRRARFWDEVDTGDRLRGKVKFYKRAVAKKRKKMKQLFSATKRVPRKVPISFETKKGEKVSFKAKKRKPKVIKLKWK